MHLIPKTGKVMVLYDKRLMGMEYVETMGGITIPTGEATYMPDPNSYDGFGNLRLDALGSPVNKVTGHEASGKFREKLMVKQRKIEVS